jgi:hypothetical protein
MFVQPQCPKCGHASDVFDLKQVTVGDRFAGPFYSGIAACCKQCHSVLGVFSDPTITIVNAIKAELKKK